MTACTYPGINIQFPISALILDGEKSIETRTYPLPKKYIRKWMVIIETPGKQGDFTARLVGLIQFDASFMYKNEAEFSEDYSKHRVSRASPWKWQKGKSKWGWPILSFKKFQKSLPAPKNKGIKYTATIEVL